MALQGAPALTEHRSATYVAIQLVLLGLGAVVLFTRWRETRGLLKEVNRPLLAFLALVPVSTLWSIDVPGTLGHFISLLCFVLFLAATCLIGWHPQRFQNVVRPVVTLLLLGSIALYAVYPDNAIEHAEGYAHAWHGLTARPGTFGSLASVAALFWMHAILVRQGRLWVNLAGAGLSVACVLLSHSSTQLQSTVFSFVVLMMLLHAPPKLRRATLYVGGLFALLNVLPYLPAFLEPAEIDPKFSESSSRLEIWSIIQQQIQSHPWLGCGYGAYWNGPSPDAPSHIFLTRMYFYPGEAHDGNLEITNDLGLVGLLLLSAYLIVFVRQALALMRTDRAQGALYVSLFLQQAIENLSESHWLQINSPNLFMIMILGTFALAREAQVRSALAAPAAESAAPVPPNRSLPPVS